MTEKHGPANGTLAMHGRVLSSPIMLSLVDRIAERVIERLQTQSQMTHGR
jgi:hypothetical protein